MKKQILFLAMFTLALIFAGMNSYGQVLNTEEDYLTADPTYCVPAVPLECGTGDALTPSPGVPFDYTIEIGTGETVHWFVTDDPDVMTAPETVTGTFDPGDGTGAYLLASDDAYNDPTNTSATVNLTWKYFSGSDNVVILVAYVIDAAGCTDNIEAYRIIPEYKFTLDIAGILDEGTEGASECVIPIQGATFDGTNLNVDYGVNYVFYTVNAANWQVSWQTDLAATTDGGSVVGDPEWAYPEDATTGGAWNASGTEVLASKFASNDNGFIGGAGECIIVRVPVTHTATENIADETISLAVNGEMYNVETTSYDGTYPDLDEGGKDSACIVDDVTDTSDYIITPRPDVNEVDPTPFVDKVPED